MKDKFEICKLHDEVFVQIGQTALRDPATGKFLPAEPLYIKVPQKEISPETKMCNREEKLIKDVSEIFADKMRQYIEGGGLGGVGKGFEL